MSTQPGQPSRLNPAAEVDVDVLIVGAGLSGIGAAYRLQTEHPHLSYAIVEARDDLGGTWDLFRYPGVRSDSDMHTLGYPFRPWLRPESIAEGGDILDYLRDTAREFGIDAKIQYRSRVVGLSWDSHDATWTIEIIQPARDGEPAQHRSLRASFVYSCTGYYDYDLPYQPEFAGIDEFEGQVLHPQFWPQDYDYRDQKVIIIGSGATAVTLAPAMAEAAAKVTMLQRSPTWVASIPRVDPVAALARKLLPRRVAAQVARTKSVIFNLAVYEFCQKLPGLARQLFTGLAASQLDDPQLVAQHFTPDYDPWDQRLCAVPNGDLFRAINDGTVEVVTDHIDRFVPTGIRLQSGHTLEADVVVTATGLQLQAIGGVTPEVDGRRVALSEEFAWQGTMVTGIPNFALCMGYTNASWTLRADLNSRLVCRILDQMQRRNQAIVAAVPDHEPQRLPLIDLAAGYILRSIDQFPHQGDRVPWRVRQNYPLDVLTTSLYNINRTLTYSNAGQPIPLQPWQQGAPTHV